MIVIAKAYYIQLGAVVAKVHHILDDQPNSCFSASEPIVFLKRFCMNFLATIVLIFTGILATFGQNEQSPIVEKAIIYRNWSLKSVRDFTDVDLRDLIKNKKL